MSPEYEPGLVSVIVPTYNRAHLIIETLDSVFAQTYRPIELLIADDGSTDNTVDIVQQWEREYQQDGFTTRLIMQENRGAPAARNLGLIESHGEFIQFLDSDDVLHPDKFETQVKSLCESSANYAWSDCAWFSGPIDWQGSMKRIHAMSSSVALAPSRGGINTIVGLYRRSTCIKIGPWNEGLRIRQDGEYNLRLLLAKTRKLYIPGVLSMFRIEHGPRICDRFRGAEMRQALQRYEDLLRDFDELNLTNRESLTIRCQDHAVQALIGFQKDLAHASLQQGLRLCGTNSRRFRLIILQSVAYLPTKASAFITRGLIALCRWRKDQCR